MEQIRINWIVRDTLWNRLDRRNSLYTTGTMGSGGGIVLLGLVSKEKRRWELSGTWDLMGFWE
jgi:hypothetical protein